MLERSHTATSRKTNRTNKYKEKFFGNKSFERSLNTGELPLPFIVRKRYLHIYAIQILPSRHIFPVVRALIHGPFFTSTRRLRNNYFPKHVTVSIIVLITRINKSPSPYTSCFCTARRVALNRNMQRHPSRLRLRESDTDNVASRAILFNHDQHASDSRDERVRTLLAASSLPSSLPYRAYSSSR